MMPSSTPPITAPGMEPKPPNTAATNPLVAMVFDMVVLMENSGTVRMPTNAQMTQEMVMVTIMFARTLMPTMALMDLFSATQRMALPVFVNFIKHVSATMTTTATATI